jgi:hypothetical protein
MQREPLKTPLKLVASFLYSDGLRREVKCSRVAFVTVPVWRRTLGAIR